MRKKRMQSKSSYYAKILFVISFSLLIYGIALDYYDSHKLINPIDDVITTNNSKDNTIHIETTNDTNKDNNNSNSNNSNNNNSQKPIIENNTQNSNRDQDNRVLTITETNNRLRKELEDKYSITIHYGEETRGYSVSGIATEIITDESVINSQLVRLKQALGVYPEGLFREIKNGGIPLTIMLVNKYSEANVTGVTDSSYSDATISISAAYAFEESFYHESYHYIERYMFKEGANYNTWDSLNPQEFQGWGTIDGNLSYSNTFSATAPFVNNYAQSEASEDRASTFEYMMASSKASCLNRENIVWRKAKLIADTIDLVLSSVRPDVTEYWERFL